MACLVLAVYRAQAGGDFRRAGRYLLVGTLWCLLSGSLHPLRAQQADTTGVLPDTTPAVPSDTARTSLLARPHRPRTALVRAAMVPGWGQYYNRQYRKMPVIYAGLGALGYLVVRLNRDYRFYDRAFLYQAFEERDPANNPYEAFKPDYDRIVAEFGNVSSSPLRQQRDNFRRNRDLSVLGIGLVYGLSILDAYVNAHLFDFDVGEDLTAQVEPHPEGGLALRLRVGF
jgi:hypothetical protein